MPDVDAAADGPQHAEKRDRGQYRGKKRKREIDRRVGGDPDVDGDPVFRILRPFDKMIEVAKSFLVEPFVDDVPRQCLAPTALCRHASPDRGGGEQGADHDQRNEQLCRGPKRLRVLALERVEKAAIPQIEQNLHQQLQEYDDNEEDGEKRHPCFLGTPELRRRLPEAGQKVLLVDDQSDLLEEAHSFNDHIARACDQYYAMAPSIQELSYRGVT